MYVECSAAAMITGRFNDSVREHTTLCVSMCVTTVHVGVWAAVDV